MSPSRLLSIVLTCCAAAACSTGEASPKPTASAAAQAAPGTTASAPAASDSLSQAADRGRVMGAESATTWLLIVSDFQCPWCKLWHDSTFPALKREYVDGGKLRAAYINFPLGIHQNAFPAAIAAMCASAQGKFWTTHDRIFETQSKWEKLSNPREYLDSLAVASGADAKRQGACSQNRLTLDLVFADQARANRSGAQTTPTFFVGGAKIEGAAPIKDFRHVVDSVLAAGTRAK